MIDFHRLGMLGFIYGPTFNHCQNATHQVRMPLGRFTYLAAKLKINIALIRPGMK